MEVKGACGTFGTNGDREQGQEIELHSTRTSRRSTPVVLWLIGSRLRGNDGGRCSVLAGEAIVSMVGR